MFKLNAVFIPFSLLPLTAHFAVVGFSRLFKLKELEAESWEALIALDRYCNSLLGGDNTETISSRLGRDLSQGNKTAILVCNFLDVFEKDHCIKSIGK